jgi:Zn-finger nucleic acid-binding protein
MARSCPSCRATMDVSPFRSHVDTPLDIDVCWPCHLIWFDHLESTSLSAESLIELFRRIHAHRAEARNIVSFNSGCPVCNERLIASQDLSKGGRFQYHRCPQGHGRLITFVQFLREKNFIRTLSSGEINKLAATVKQVRCSSCGAGIDIQRDHACTHCGSPISVLDTQAVDKALADLDRRREQRRAIGTPSDIVLPSHREPRAAPARYTEPLFDKPGEDLADLLMAGVAALISISLD